MGGGKGRRGKEEGKNGEGDLPVEGAGAVEEFEVEGCGGLAVDFPAGAGLHGHVSFLLRVVDGDGGVGVEGVGLKLEDHCIVTGVLRWM